MCMQIKIGTLSLMFGIDCFLTPMANCWLIRYSIDLLFISTFIGVKIVSLFRDPTSAIFCLVDENVPPESAKSFKLVTSFL